MSLESGESFLMFNFDELCNMWRLNIKKSGINREMGILPSENVKQDRKISLF